MDDGLRTLLAELHEFGRRNDAALTAYEGRMLNITPETGELLRMLVIVGGMRHVLELGTSNGYSTIWLADGCRQVGGKVLTFDISPAKHAAALENLRRAGLEGFVDARVGDAGQALPGLRDFDLVFLDTDRTLYAAWWPDLQRSVRVGGLLVVDNATSHADEVRPLAQAVRRTPGFSSVLVPIGNGELVVLREA